jgi:hypothetical protein
MLRNLFGFTTRGDGYGQEKPKEPEKMMPEDMRDKDMPDDEDTVDEADIDAIVSRFTDAIKGVVMEMAKEKKACSKPKKTTMPDETKPNEGMEDDEEAEAMSALLMAEHLLTDLELEAALKEGQ